MTKVDIFSGFLGAGKTTLIKKLISEAYVGQKLVLIENEFGEIGIDGGFLKDAGINITEMNSGCICCSLVGDFGKALVQVIDEYHPDRVIIEPSGVGKLSDVIGAVNKVANAEVSVGYTVAVADAGKIKVYMKNFGEFYNNQIETASTIILSRSDSVTQAKLDAGISLIRERNPHATIVTTPWTDLTGAQLMEALEGKATVAMELDSLESELRDHKHHHHDHEDHHHHEHDHSDHTCSCGHHHDHEDHRHHEHDHGDHSCSCGHHHDHGEHCTCGHDHNHHADEVFTSWGRETHKKFGRDFIESALHDLDSGKYGIVLRAKGIVPCAEGGWIHFDMVPEEINIRFGSADVNGKICVIGAKLDENGVSALFGV